MNFNNLSASAPILNKDEDATTLTQATDMCQTEFGFLKKDNKLSMVAFRTLAETRLLVKVSKEHDFQCGNALLEAAELKKNDTPQCRSLETAPGAGFQDPEFFEKSFCPWLEESLQILSSYAGFFTSKSRCRLMFEWLRKGANTSGCSRLRSTLSRCIELDTFDNMIAALRTSCGLKEGRENEINVKKLLNWKGATIGTPINVAWSDFLDIYQSVPAEDCKANNDNLCELINKFACQHPTLLSYVGTQLKTYNYVDNEGDLISDVPSSYERPCHLRLACLITDAVSCFFDAFEKSVPMLAVYPFGAFCAVRTKGPAKEAGLSVSSENDVKILAKRHSNFENKFAGEKRGRFADRHDSQRPIDRFASSGARENNGDNSNAAKVILKPNHNSGNNAGSVLRRLLNTH